MKNIFFFPSFLSLLILFSCSEKQVIPTQPQSAIDGAIQELNQALMDQEIQGTFSLEAIEDEGSLTVSLKNKAIGNKVAFPDEESSVLLGLSLEKDYKDQSSTIYKSQLMRNGRNLVYELTDLNNQSINKKKSQIPDDIFESPTPPICPVFDSFDDCLKDFWCNEGAKLQCQANETCEVIITGLCCCDNAGNCVWYDFIHIYPENPLCPPRGIEAINIPVMEVLLR
ncbi:MAG: hypothetical protein MI974_23775 [Chitinophagales bacterium]|nr:hypothetical protein [Chitinophagales bacterium]